jgi:hypothetical protein
LVSRQAKVFCLALENQARAASPFALRRIGAGRRGGTGHGQDEQNPQRAPLWPGRYLQPRARDDMLVSTVDRV